MPRKAKPYIKDGWYCTSINGLQHQKLCRVGEGKRNAEIALARLMVIQDDRRNQQPASVIQITNEQPTAPVTTVSQIINDYMAFVQSESSDGTYRWYREKLWSMYERYGSRPTVGANALTYEDGLAYKLGYAQKRNGDAVRPNSTASQLRL